MYTKSYLRCTFPRVQDGRTCICTVLRTMVILPVSSSAHALSHISDAHSHASRMAIHAHTLCCALCCACMLTCICYHGCAQSLCVCVDVLDAWESAHPCLHAHKFIFRHTCMRYTMCRGGVYCSVYMQPQVCSELMHSCGRPGRPHVYVCSPTCADSYLRHVLMNTPHALEVYTGWSIRLHMYVH